MAGFKRGSADEQKANKKQGQNIFVSKAPLCKGNTRKVCKRSEELSAKLTEGLSNATEITKKGK